jgi:hypothetical protein
MDYTARYAKTVGIHVVYRVSGGRKRGPGEGAKPLTFVDLFATAAAATPDPDWDFEPDQLTIERATTVVVSHEGGEPHALPRSTVSAVVDSFRVSTIMRRPVRNAPVVRKCSGSEDSNPSGPPAQCHRSSWGKDLFHCCIQTLRRG